MQYVFEAALPSRSLISVGIRKSIRERDQKIRNGAPVPLPRMERVTALCQEKGEVRTKDLTDIGIPSSYLTELVREGTLVRVRRGSYRLET